MAGTSLSRLAGRRESSGKEKGRQAKIRQAAWRRLSGVAGGGGKGHEKGRSDMTWLESDQAGTGWAVGVCGVMESSGDRQLAAHAAGMVKNPLILLKEAGLKRAMISEYVELVTVHGAGLLRQCSFPHALRHACLDVVVTCFTHMPCAASCTHAL